MIKAYWDNCTFKTKPYEGIIELLDSLISSNFKLGVLSNKTDELTMKITLALLHNYFGPVIGLSIEVNKNQIQLEH